MKKQKEPKLIREYVSCSCNTELLELSYFDAEYEDLYISYYSCGQKGNNYSWGTRLRYIWKVIRTGTPFNDYIILNKEEIKKLKQFLKKIK